MKPFVKWAGGKRQIIQRILPYIDEHLDNNSRYFEPFVGGGSVFLRLHRKNCVINDLNKELINCYRVIKTQYLKLIAELKVHEKFHYRDRNYYYLVRRMDRDEKMYSSMDNVQKAARTIYLNKTCYNGLYRVNQQGFFNTPKGRYKRPNIVDESNLKELYFFLRSNNISIRNTSFDKAIKDVKEGDFVYFDPPYDYEGKGFTGYVKEGFTYNDLELLKVKCDELIKRGAKVLISNNATDRVLKLFNDDHYEIWILNNGQEAKRIYKHETFEVRRTINSSSNGDNIAKEVLIYGYREI